MKHTVSLKLNHEFRRLYNKGKSAVSPYFVIYCRKTGRAESRLGITTGVKLGKAVLERCREHGTVIERQTIRSKCEVGGNGLHRAHRIIFR